MSNETAYRTADPAVLAEWEKYKTGAEEVRVKRDALREAVGRDIYVNRGTGFGSTQIVGFERFDSDKDGDLVHHGGCLVVSSKRSQHNGLIVPNLRRKVGKEFTEELAGYTSPGLKLPGMATFHTFFADGNLYLGGPSIAVWDGVMFALWQTDGAPVEDNWERIPLSTYYLMREQHGDD